MTRPYRADIDGLRAVAVLAIVLFHAGVPGFAGGYVGVDVFFVISGYLITGIVAGDLAAGRFSVRGFYLRRIRRIFPALFVMLAVTAGVGWLLLFPVDLIAFARSLIGAAAMVANVQAWLQAGYFDPASHTKPLLHTWSLAVEEQFYVVFPLVLALCVRRRLPERRVVWLLFAASLAASIVWLGVDATATFYLLPTRAWELLAGALVALGAVPRPTAPWLRQAVAAAGMAMIVAAILAFDAFTPFPGAAALLPCVGTALVILAGGPGVPTLAARALSARPLTLVGLASYSIYLWHWPIIVFAHHLVVRHFTGPEKAALVAAALGTGFLSWRLIETPFRRPRARFETVRVFGGAAAAVAAVIAFGAILVPDGFPGRYSAAMRRLFDQVEIPATAFAALKGHPAYAGLGVPTGGFVAGRGDGPPEIAIWGDSHVDLTFPFVATAIADGSLRAATIFAKGGCRPLPDSFVALDPDVTCRDHNRWALDYLKSGPEKRVVLVSRWGLSLYGEVEPEGRGAGRPRLARAPGGRMSVAEAEAFFAERLAATVDALLAAGKAVTIVEPFAEIPFEGKRATFRAVLADSDLDSLSVSLRPYEARYAAIGRIMDAALAGRPVQRIVPWRFLCPDGRCPLYRDGTVVFADDNHLTWQGSLALAPLFRPLLAPAERPPAVTGSGRD